MFDQLASFHLAVITTSWKNQDLYVIHLCLSQSNHILISCVRLGSFLLSNLCCVCCVHRGGVKYHLLECGGENKPVRLVQAAGKHEITTSPHTLQTGYLFIQGANTANHYTNVKTACFWSYFGKLFSVVLSGFGQRQTIL